MEHCWKEAAVTEQSSVPRVLLCILVWGLLMLTLSSNPWMISIIGNSCTTKLHKHPAIPCVTVARCMQYWVCQKWHCTFHSKKKRISDTIFRYYCLCLPGICFGEIFLALKQCPKTHPLPHRQFLDVMSPSRLNFLHISIGRFTDTWLCVYVQCMYVQYCKLGKLRCWNIFVCQTNNENQLDENFKTVYLWYEKTTCDVETNLPLIIHY